MDFIYSYLSINAQNDNDIKNHGGRLPLAMTKQTIESYLGIGTGLLFLTD